LGNAIAKFLWPATHRLVSDCILHRWEAWVNARIITCECFASLATGRDRTRRDALVRLSRLPAIFVGAFLVNLTTAGNAATSVAIAAGNTLEALAGAWLVNRFGGGKHFCDRPQGVFKFAIAAAISTMISAALGVTSLALAGFANWSSYSAIWVTLVAGRRNERSRCYSAYSALERRHEAALA
jgi:hypothetical protein